ncbi:hypothetical protein JCM3766R1_002429, partial [Sporobolomyces carnicolor]
IAPEECVDDDEPVYDSEDEDTLVSLATDRVLGSIAQHDDVQPGPCPSSAAAADPTLPHDTVPQASKRSGTRQISHDAGALKGMLERGESGQPKPNLPGDGGQVVPTTRTLRETAKVTIKGEPELESAGSS